VIQRVIVERLQPEVDAGRFPVKRTVGEPLSITVDVFADGHDLLAGVLKYRRATIVAAPPPADGAAVAMPDASDGRPWIEVPLAMVDNDSWGATFTPTELGRYEYTVEAWIDRFGSWLKGLTAKFDAGQDVSSELLEGAALAESAGLGDVARRLSGPEPQADRVGAALDPLLRAQMDARPDRSASTTYARVLSLTVDPIRARFGSWYEMFPRSCTPDPSRSGTFVEAAARLPEIAGMGFDVLYLPPVHPIGTTHRKGRNNALTAEATDPGSPWAIGAAAGGHTAIEPGLGTLDDFDRFVAAAQRAGLEIALDIAFQASPDHPWVREHPQWFKHRPDGSIKYAENPPKKYQDIYPIDFESSDAAALWEELKQVFLFWVSHGVKIFRVDNPHTKAFAFWEWCIRQVQGQHPDTIFLAEAFTRPKVMRYLAKAGFTQSYTYYTWRNSGRELQDYLTELTSTELQDYMRPNFFANTPDILHEYLQRGGRPAFETRLILAGTLAASYGIYSGYELCENLAVKANSEEYLDSEKYQIRVRDWNQPGNLKQLIARLNSIRREHPALQQNATLQFHRTDNPALLWFSKRAGNDRVFVVANTDPFWLQHGWLELPLHELGLGPGAFYEVEDLLDGSRYAWRGTSNYVRLDPAERMGHIFVIRDL
jgi:starch synthase (maltosyl-transferring)